MTKPRFDYKPQPLTSVEEQIYHHLLEAARLIEQVAITSDTHEQKLTLNTGEKIIHLVANVMTRTAAAMKRGAQ